MIKRRYSDKEIVQGLLSENNSLVLKYLISNNRTKVINYVVKNSGITEDGEELLFDAITIFYENVRNNKFQLQKDCSIDTYIYRICINSWLNILKKRRLDFVSLDTIHKEAKQEEDTNNDNDNQKQLKLLVENLGEPCKSIFYYKYYESLNNEQIAEKMKYKNSDSVKTQKYKCIMRLKKMVKKNNIKL